MISAPVVLTRDIRLVMEGKPRNLIETVATDIATNILQDYSNVKGLKISVQKPHVALDGVVKSMGEPPSWSAKWSVAHCERGSHLCLPSCMNRSSAS